MSILCYTDILLRAKNCLLDTEYQLDYCDGALSLIQLDKKPFVIDFLSGKNQHRRLYPTQGEVIIKATLAKEPDIQIFDLTAGLGRDAFLMASAGAHVSLFERHPVIFILLADAIERLKDALPDVASRLNLTYLDANTLQVNVLPDVVYVDPMHPPRKSRAAVKQDMRIIQSLVGEDADKENLFQLALNLAKKRVVVKWPVKVPSISDVSPSFVYQGKSTNFEVYLR